MGADGDVCAETGLCELTGLGAVVAVWAEVVDPAVTVDTVVVELDGSRSDGLGLGTAPGVVVVIPYLLRRWAAGLPPRRHETHRPT